ncbi:cadherin-related family member 5-like [Prinia subflava]|uniref:cadherin-related family member 5-like n=1 Tax=Prinia subflava TaxID=208062 RepID=UPI002FE01E83
MVWGTLKRPLGAARGEGSTGRSSVHGKGNEGVPAGKQPWTAFPGGKVSVGICTGVTHRCDTPGSHTGSHSSVTHQGHTQGHTPVSHTGVTQQGHTQGHTPVSHISVTHRVTPCCHTPLSPPSTHTPPRGWHAPPFPLPCFVLARCPSPARPGSRGARLGRRGCSPPGPPGAPRGPCRSPTAPGCGARRAEVLGMDAAGVTDKEGSRKPGPAPCQQPRLPEHVPSLSLHGGSMSPPHGCWRGFALHGWGRTVLGGRMLRAASALWGWHGGQPGCCGGISQPTVGFWRMARRPQQCPRVGRGGGRAG